MPEVLAAALQARRRATVVGLKTPGNVESFVDFVLPDGSRLTIMTSAYLSPAGLEVGIDGVRPDVPASLDWDQVSERTDPVRNTAVSVLRRGKVCSGGGGVRQQQITRRRPPPPGQSQNATRIYQTPIWSPDGSRVAFVGIDSFQGRTSGRVLTARADGTDAQAISTGGRLPANLYWSPDSRKISFLTAGAGGGGFLLLSWQPASATPVQTLDAGRPLFWGWAPDSTGVTVHAGSVRTSGRRVSFLEVGATVIESGLPLQPGEFQTPAWSPDGSGVVLATIADGGLTDVVITHPERRDHPPDVIASARGAVTFLWSPDGASLGYITRRQEVESIVSRLHLRDNEGSDQALVLTLRIYDRERRASVDIETFVPTPQFAAVIRVFDQYGQAARIWSPDSRNIVYSALTDAGPYIMVARAAGNLVPRKMAPGLIGFWSCREDSSRLERARRRSRHATVVLRWGATRLSSPAPCAARR
ncbi:hypothetical protein GBAR_LOCUS23855 [Geodia barretti]|uniref:Tail specific protease domain-containing protein n=1 Tax=Geodia barretti TaxID=519541 RepID=A0AA35T7S0_GEOBA|nr:hypothetical protein GBAR_LOCUS23855 [Geodia barretti]